IRISVQREPEELAAPRGGGERPAFQTSGEIARAVRMPGECALIEHVHRAHPCTDDGRRQACSDDLDLGELRHRRVGQEPDGSVLALSSRQAVSAAAISAVFLLVPLPVQLRSPTTTVAVNTRSWSGPAASTEYRGVVALSRAASSCRLVFGSIAAP